MENKSTTCMGKNSGPLTEYTTQSNALAASAYVERVHGRPMVAYCCQRCRMWHLAAAERHTPSHPCGVCVGSDRQPKQSYRTESEAERRAKILEREQRVRLRSYACPHGDGWHLTKA